MSGRSANESISAAKATIKSLRMGDAGVGGPESDTSMIGGEARKGADANGNLSEAPYHRIDAEHSPEGSASKGEMGVGYGVGKKFGG